MLGVGELDDITPPEHARRIASTLPNAYLFEFDAEDRVRDALVMQPSGP